MPRAALAAPPRNHSSSPKQRWRRQIKVEKGCYEVYAVDKAGKKVNLAYNAETLEKLDNAEAGEN